MASEVTWPRDGMILQWAWIVWIRGGDIAAVICCALAFWRGGTTERYGAGIIASCWIATALLTAHEGKGPGNLVVAIDILAFVLFLALTLASRRLWVFFATSCQLNAVVSHFVVGLTSYGIYGYITAVGFWGGWALLICLACGVIGYRRSLKSMASL